MIACRSRCYIQPQASCECQDYISQIGLSRCRVLTVRLWRDSKYKFFVLKKASRILRDGSAAFANLRNVRLCRQTNCYPCCTSLSLFFVFCHYQFQYNLYCCPNNMIFTQHTIPHGSLFHNSIFGLLLMEIEHYSFPLRLVRNGYMSCLILSRVRNVYFPLDEVCLESFFVFSECFTPAGVCASLYSLGVIPLIRKNEA